MQMPACTWTFLLKIGATNHPDKGLDPPNGHCPNELLYFLIGASLSLYAVIPQCSDILPNNSPSSTDEPLWWLCKKMGEISLQIPLKNTQNLS